MSNRISPTANRMHHPDISAASDSQGVEKDYSFDELRAMPFPPCSTSEYAELRDKLFSNGRLVCANDQDKAGALAFEFLRDGKTTVLKWLAANCTGFHIEIPADGEDPLLLDRLCDWLQTGAHGCDIKLTFATLRTFEQVASVVPWSLLSIEHACSVRDVEKREVKRCGSLRPSCWPGPRSLALQYGGRDGVDAFSYLTRLRAASAKLQLTLETDLGKSTSAELVKALLKANSLHQLSLCEDATMSAEIFEALALNITSGLRSMSLRHGKIDAEAAKHFAAFLSQSRSLETLVIHFTNLADATAELIPGLASNTSLKSLDFVPRGLSTDTVRQFVAPLAQKPHLQRLVIWNQKLGSVDVKELADSFCEHAGMRELGLGLDSPLCDIDSEEAGKAMAYLVRTTRLRVLEISVNKLESYQFEGEGHQQFVAAAMTSPTLWEVRYDFTDREAARAHFKANRERHLQLARAGFSLASLDTPLPPELDDIMIHMLERLEETDNTALDGLADLAIQALPPPSAMDSLV